MFHPDTQHLIETWTRLAWDSRLSDDLPCYSRLRPENLGQLLPRAFSLDVLEQTSTIRVAGAWIETLHGRRLTGSSFGDLWSDRSRDLVNDWLLRSVYARAPIVILAEAGASERVDVVLAPLVHRGRHVRILGLYGSKIRPIEGAPRLLQARLALTAGENRVPGSARSASRRLG